MGISHKESKFSPLRNGIISTHFQEVGMAFFDAIGVMIKCVVNWRVGPRHLQIPDFVFPSPILKKKTKQKNRLSFVCLAHVHRLGLIH
jgi:hypothetical protein